MSDLGIFSLLVVGRDMPHPFARADAAMERAMQAHRSTSRAKSLESVAETAGTPTSDELRRPQ